MKLFNKILFGAAALTVTAAFTSCKEEATLSGADAVYITMANTDVTMLAGDTLRLSARVENASGNEIVTPITWSVDDESVVKISEIVIYKNVKNEHYIAPEEPGSPSEGEDEGENIAASRSDEEGDETTAPDVNTTDEYVKVPKETYLGIIAQPGSQGKSTVIRATLENGMYAVTTVTIGRNEINGAVKAVKEEMMSYNDIMNDTCWFEVSPIGVVDDYDVNFSFDFIEKVTEAEDPAEADFVPTTYGDGPIYVDRANSRVGVVFTAPRLAGKATCTLTIGNEQESSSASTTIFLFPQLTSGLEYIQNGVRRRPGPGIETPSNIKPKMETVSLDINSEHLVGVCIGVRTQRPVDIANAMAAEKAGYFTWDVSGSSVIVEESFFDEDYQNSGYVSYLKVRSGIRTGLSRVTFTIPGECIDTDYDPQTYICDINVMDFNQEYPVTDILMKDTDAEDSGTIYQDGELLQASIGTPLNIYISTVPDASFSFHIPEVVSSDPSILRVEERGADDGFRRQFTPLKPGTVTLTITSLDVTRTLRVEVNDRVQRTQWTVEPVAQLTKGTSASAEFEVYMYSDVNTPAASFDGDIKWTSSNPSVISIDVDPNDPRKATINGIGEGTSTVRVDISGKYGEYAMVKEISVEELKGIEYPNADINLENSFIGYSDDESNSAIWIFGNDDSIMSFEFQFSEDILGHFAGSDGVLRMYNADGDETAVLENSSYDLTITDNGDGTYTVNGSYTSSLGAVYTFNNLVISVLI